MLKQAIIIIFLFFLSRFIGLPANFSPLLALAVYIPRISNHKGIKYFLPTAILLGSNLFLEPVNSVILFSMTFVFLLTPFLSHFVSNLFLRTILSVLIWHLVVNGSVWMVSRGSLIETYLAAIPFDFSLLLSTGLYVALFYACEQIYFRIKFPVNEKI